MDNKSDFRLITTLGEYVNSQLVRKEGEDINQQVSFDFHTCFDANSLFLKNQEAGTQLQKKGGLLSL